MVFLCADVDVCFEDLVVVTAGLGAPFLPLWLDVVCLAAPAAFVVVADLPVFFVDDGLDGRVVFFE